MNLTLKLVRLFALALPIFGWGTTAAALVTAPIIEWQHYTSQRWNFCVDVPRAWVLSEGIDKAGVLACRTGQPQQRGRTCLEVGGRTDQPSSANSNRLEGLDEIFSGAPDTLEPTSNIKVAQKQSVAVKGIPAIKAKITYEEGGEAWTAENLTMLSPDKTVYLIELRYPDRDSSALRGVFSHIVNSFRPNCAAGRSQ